MKIVIAISIAISVVSVVFVFWGVVLEYLTDESKEERIALERMRRDREEDEAQKRGR